MGPLDRLENLLIEIRRDFCLPPSGNTQIDSLFQELCQVAERLLKRIELIINQG